MFHVLRNNVKPKNKKITGNSVSKRAWQFISSDKYMHPVEQFCFWM